MSAGRILLLVAGTIAGLAAAALIAAGTTALWADHSKTDKDGYFSSGRQAVSTQTHAFVSDPIEIDEGADWIFDEQGDLTFRIAAAGAGGEPVFVGVAPKDAVATYLTGVSYEQVTDIDGDPFQLDTTPHSGTATPIAPTRAGIWERSVSGAGTQTLDWRPKQGDWAVVVMNADGSAGVSTQSTFGAKVSFLAEVGLALLVGGLVLLVSSVLFVYFALRGRGTTPTAPAVAVPLTA
jgi:hypothetical protein